MNNIQKNTRKASKKANYVDNKMFLQSIIDYKEKVKQNEIAGKGPPRVPEYVGECILKIATHLSYSHNFINYSFREDMISDGIENCLMYFDNFDPTKTKNPFGYFTQIIYYAFLRRIGKEKKQQYVKYKSFENNLVLHDLAAEYADRTSDDSNTKLLTGPAIYDNIGEFIEKFEEAHAKKKASSKTRKQK
jgi:hypothetical protein